MSVKKQSLRNVVCTACNHRHDGWTYCPVPGCDCTVLVVDPSTEHNEEFRSVKAVHARIGASAPSYDVVRWPEFLAFAKRLGIALDLPFRDLVISLPFDDSVTITQSYLADDIDQPSVSTPLDGEDRERIDDMVGTAPSLD